MNLDDIMTDTNTIVKPELKLQRPSMYTCVFKNDDYTPMDFVVGVLCEVFHQSLQDATLIMLKVHTEGKAAVGSYTYEVASHKCDTTIGMARKNEFPLQVVPEPI